jgi:hypothetical protein
VTGDAVALIDELALQVAIEVQGDGIGGQTGQGYKAEQETGDGGSNCNWHGFAL